jgi:hypothetical protein
MFTRRMFVVGNCPRSATFVEFIVASREGYGEYSYALLEDIPVVKVLNAAGYYTAPTAGHVGVSLLNAKINMDSSNPGTYLTEDLSQVYTDPDPRTYELSGYSYMILPTTTEFGFTAAKGLTLGDFGKFALCQGQARVASLGYSPLPINLVEAGYAQLRRIPGAQVPPVTLDFIRLCNNPTFSTDGTNTLALNDPMPLPCDKAGAVQCAADNGSGGVLSETIDMDVPSSEGGFTMTVSGTPVQLSDAVLSPDGTVFESTGRLGTVTISDGRGQSRPGWSVSGQVGDFTGGAHPFSGSYLGWTPAVATQNPANDVVAGPAVPPGTDPGLKGGSGLANAAATKGVGTAVLDAALDLKVPASTAAGSYSATLTITAVETA